MIKQPILILSMLLFTACVPIKTTLEPAGNGRISVEYTQGTPSLGMCGFYHASYYYEIDFLDDSGHYTPKNFRVRTGIANNPSSMALNNVEGTVELKKASSVVVIDLYEVDSIGRRTPLTINGYHKYQVRVR